MYVHTYDIVTRNSESAMFWHSSSPSIHFSSHPRPMGPVSSPVYGSVKSYIYLYMYIYIYYVDKLIYTYYIYNFVVSLSLSLYPYTIYFGSAFQTLLATFLSRHQARKSDSIVIIWEMKNTGLWITIIRYDVYIYTYIICRGLLNTILLIYLWLKKAHENLQET